MKIITIIFFGFGAAICCLNFYLSYIRYGIHRLFGRSKESYQWASGIPMLGSLLVMSALFIAWSNPLIRTTGIVFLLIDTCGPLWLAGSILYEQVMEKKKIG